MYLSSPAHGWFDAIGGWPNLFQGLLSAAVTGLVAALVSFAVVKLTNDAARKLSRKQEVRDKLIDVVESAIDTFLGVPDNRSWRRDLEAAANLNFKLRLAAALVAELDITIADKIQKSADQLARVANSWSAEPSLQADSKAPERYNASLAIVVPLHEVIINWLGDINPNYTSDNQSVTINPAISPPRPT